MTQNARGDHFDLNEALDFLATTPETLQDFLANLPDSWLDFKEDSEAWSPRRVLVHFIHNEQTNWIVRTRGIQPIGWVGHTRIFGPDALDRVAEELRGARASRRAGQSRDRASDVS